MLKWKANPFVNKAGESVFSICNLIKIRGWTVRLHKFTHADDPGCFHSHPADAAYRVILWGGYIEEFLDGSKREWRVGNFGVVRHDLVHRIDKLFLGCSISLWIRGPIRHKVEYGCIE